MYILGAEARRAGEVRFGLVDRPGDPPGESEHPTASGGSQGEGHHPSDSPPQTAEWVTAKKREFHGMTDRAKKHSPEILTREEVLELLSSKAAASSVTAMVCLERALRSEPVVDFDDELEQALYGGELRVSGNRP